MSFYEIKATSIGLNKSLIVEKNSAVMNLATERRTKASCPVVSSTICETGALMCAFSSFRAAIVQSQA